MVEDAGDADEADGAAEDGAVESWPTASTDEVGVEVAAACGGGEDCGCAASFEPQAARDKEREKIIADAFRVRLKIMHMLLH
jgi:hypothetical protein